MVGRSTKENAPHRGESCGEAPWKPQLSLMSPSKGRNSQEQEEAENEFHTGLGVAHAPTAGDEKPQAIKQQVRFSTQICCFTVQKSGPKLKTPLTHLTKA